MTLQKTYAKQIHEGLSWGGTWLPSMAMEVGDVGTFIDGVFVKALELGDVGISFSQEDAAHEADLTFVSQNGIKIDVKAAGETSQDFSAVAQAKAGVKVSFERSAGIVMSLSGLTGKQIANRVALEQELRERLNTGLGWQEDYAVVVQRLEAKSGTIVVSRDRGTKIEFEAEGNLPGGAAALGSLSAGASLAYADAMSQLLVGKHGLTPLFHTLRLDRGFWSGQLKPIYYRSDDGAPPPAASGQEVPENGAFRTVDYDEET